MKTNLPVVEFNKHNHVSHDFVKNLFDNRNFEEQIIVWVEKADKFLAAVNGVSYSCWGECLLKHTSTYQYKNGQKFEYFGLFTTEATILEEPPKANQFLKSAAYQVDLEGKLI